MSVFPRLLTRNLLRLKALPRVSSIVQYSSLAPKLKTIEMTTVQKDLYILPNETPVVPLDCTAAFESELI